MAPLRTLGSVMMDKAGHWLAAALFFSIAAIVQTWPLILHTKDHIMGWAPDSYHFMWTLWWVKQAIVELNTNPFHSDIIFFPQGTDLYLNTMVFVNGVLSIPMQLVSGNVMLSWNSLCLAFFVLSALGAYMLSYRVTGSRWAALLSGYIFAFSPFVLTRIHGHLNIATTWPIPLFALLLLRFHETGRLREMVALGVVWAVLTYNWFEFAIDAGTFLVLFVVVQALFYLRHGDRAKARELLRGTAIAAGVWLAISAPLLIPSVISTLSGDVSNRGGLSPPTEFYSADLLGFVTPSPLWGPGEFSKADLPGETHAVIGGVETTVFLGIVPLLLAGSALLFHWKSPQRWMMLFWAGTFIFFSVMALGPLLYVGGEKEVAIGGVSFSVSLPFRVYDNIPIIGLRSVPARMIVFGTLALSVLAGMGLDGLMSRLSWVRRATGPLVAILALALVILEYWNPPVSLAHFSAPMIYEEIQGEQGDFAVLDLPLGRATGIIQRGDVVGAAIAEYGQTIHGKPVVGGYISRAKDKDVLWLEQVPGLKYLGCSLCPGLPDADDRNPALVRAVFNGLRIKYVIVHKVDLEGRPMSYELDGTAAAVQEYLETVVGLTKVTEDIDYIAYKSNQ